jgi:hypothetical protein
MDRKYFTSRKNYNHGVSYKKCQKCITWELKTGEIRKTPKYFKPRKKVK